MVNKFSKLALCTFLAMGSVEVSFEPNSDLNDFYNINEVIPALTSGLNWSISMNQALAFDTTPIEPPDPIEPPERIEVNETQPDPLEIDWGWDISFDDWNDSDWSSSGGGSAESSDEECAGNPIMVANGEKVEYETDFIGKEQHPLEISRAYSSKNNIEGAFGKGWSSSFDKRFDVSKKMLYRGDGKSVRLYSGSFDVPIVGRKTGYKSSSGKNYIYQDNLNNWIFRNESDQNEIYDSQGRLIQVSFSERPDELIYFGTLQIQSYGVSHKYSYGEKT